MRQRFALLFLSIAALGACGDDDKPSSSLDGGHALDAALPPSAGDASTSTDAGITPVGDAAVAPTDCFLNPSTYLEILNACTDAEKVVKDPVLPLLMVDGGLPPLP